MTRSMFFMLAALPLAAVLSAPAGEARSLDGFLKGIEFCQQSTGFRTLRDRMNALVPISHSPIDRRYEIGPKMKAQVASAVPAKVRDVRITETDGHMSYVVYLEAATYAGLPIDYINVWNGALIDDAFGFAVMFSAPGRQVEAMFGAAVDWANRNRYRQRPPFTGTLLSSSNPGIICSAYN